MSVSGYRTDYGSIPVAGGRHSRTFCGGRRSRTLLASRDEKGDDHQFGIHGGLVFGLVFYPDADARYQQNLGADFDIEVGFWEPGTAGDGEESIPGFDGLSERSARQGQFEDRLLHSLLAMYACLIWVVVDHSQLGADGGVSK